MARVYHTKLAKNERAKFEDLRKAFKPLGLFAACFNQGVLEKLLEDFRKLNYPLCLHDDLPYNSEDWMKTDTARRPAIDGIPLDFEGVYGETENESENREEAEQDASFNPATMIVIHDDEIMPKGLYKFG